MKKTNELILKVSQKGEGFSTLTQALQALPTHQEDPVIIEIGPGEYREKVTISRPFVTLRGTDARNTVIVYDDYAYAPMPDGSRRGTFRSYTMLLESHDITLLNLTVRNDSGPRSRAGQALALYADGDRILVKNCRLESYQDTLFTGPLPPAPLSKGGFTGPREFAPRINGRQLYENCRICGDIDFIFGSATAFFDHCEIASVWSEPPADPSVYGYVTASSTPEGQTYGYVFYCCDFTSTCPDNTVYLGRPWRDFAKTVLLHCRLGAHIKPEGFHDWNKPNAHHTILYAEYANTGKGARPKERAPYVKQLSEAEACLYSREKVLGDWKPSQSVI